MTFGVRHTISTLLSFVYDTALLTAKPTKLIKIRAAQIPGDYILQGIA